MIWVKVMEKEIVAYILTKAGCTHPFRVSRLLAMAEMEWLERRGERLTGLKYVKGPGVFFIEGLKEIIDSDPCFRIHEGDPATGRKGCVEYVCGEPALPSDVREVIDEVIRRYSGIGDMELNEAVMSDPRFARVAGD